MNLATSARTSFILIFKVGRECPHTTANAVLFYGIPWNSNTDEEKKTLPGSLGGVFKPFWDRNRIPFRSYGVIYPCNINNHATST